MRPVKDFIRDTDPWWFRAAYILGVPTIFSGFLIYILAWRVDTALTDTAKTLSDHMVQMERSITMQRQMLNIMQQICVNQAPDPTARVNCFGSLNQDQP